MDWSWAGPAVDVRPLFPRERAELIGMLRTLDAADWQRPTICPGWRVHDIAAHLAHDYLRKLSAGRDAFAAPGPMPAEDLPAFLHRVNQEFVDVAARWSPAVLIDLLAHLGPQLDRHWGMLDLAALGEPVSWAAPGEPAPGWLDVGREYSEYWVHQQQIRDAVAAPGASGPDLMGPVIDVFVRAVPYALRTMPAAAGSCLLLDVSGPGGGSWTAAPDRGRWAIRPGGCANPAAAARLPGDTLWRVATGGITVAEALDRARLEGDQSLAAAALGLVSIVR